MKYKRLKRLLETNIVGVDFMPTHLLRATTRVATIADYIRRLIKCYFSIILNLRALKY